MDFFHIQENDPQIYNLIMQEYKRQMTSLELIPSECIASLAVMEALGSPFTNKYSEGYPGKRYYAGNEVIDEVEKIAIERAKKLYNVEHVNVQVYSGSPANFAVYHALCNVGDTTMGLRLTDGGHLTHGRKVSATAKYFRPILYGLNQQGYIDIEEVRQLAQKHLPKLIRIGATAYSRILPFKEFSEIAESVGAYLVADISHISGLVISGIHPSPVPYAHIITTTTHKTLGGPRGGMIMITKKGIEKDPDLAKKIDKAVFPGLQGGPHNHQTLAIAVALGEAMKPSFVEQNKQIVKNAKIIAKELLDAGLHVISGGTDNHLILIDVGTGKGIFMQEACEMAGISVNKNTIPQDPASAFYPSGIRLGTPIMTMRGMKEVEAKYVAKLLVDVYQEIIPYKRTNDPQTRKKIMQTWKQDLGNNKKIQKIRKAVEQLCLRFPIYQ